MSASRDLIDWVRSGRPLTDWHVEQFCHQVERACNAEAQLTAASQRIAELQKDLSRFRDLAYQGGEKLIKVNADNARLRALHQNIIDSYEARSELYTSDAECAKGLAAFAKAAIGTREGESPTQPDPCGLV